MLSALIALAALAGEHPSALGSRDEPRVRAAREAHADAIAELFAAAKVPYPPASLLIRVFKLEDALELWAQPAKGAPFVRLKTYPVCARSGGPGPKRREGDGQVPEGFYEISGFNPFSNYLLSMRVSYPNAADKKRSSAPRLGGDIFIHGSCVTIGCLPLGDDAISELYVIAKDTRGKVAAHLFPARLDAAHAAELEAAADGDRALLSFWDELRPGYAYFEEKRLLPRIGVDAEGRYRLER